VIGLDNIRLASEIHPPLTTVALPQAEIGKMAMQMLLDLLQRVKPAEKMLNAQVETQLIIRQSTSRPGG
jgi:LacI family transcriptional regulator